MLSDASHLVLDCPAYALQRKEAEVQPRSEGIPAWHFWYRKEGILAWMLASVRPLAIYKASG
eukprot:3373888-Amphidinium_carterae.2